MNAAREALSRAVNRAIANGSPVYVEIAAPRMTGEEALKACREAGARAFGDCPDDAAWSHARRLWVRGQITADVMAWVQNRLA